MTDLFKPFLLAALLGAAPAAFAQETTQDTATTDTEAATDAEADTGADPLDLNMGSVEGEEIPLGAPYTKEVTGDWEVRCIRTEQENDPCQLYQLLQDGQGNSVAEINVLPLPSGQKAAAGANIVVPLETLLNIPLRLVVDGGKARTYPYTFCNVQGCLSRVGFTNADVAAFRAGNEATLTIVPAAAPDQKVELKISLTGFTAGLAAAKAAAGIE
ncbi:invasion associated locus B family protein [Algirhabdus cladophorae]|uniref:invasion associated locus B family protein n=1 Tax=Algirhabdus cladophorae TaxID=3377108 RepID=UPI003B8479FF